MRTAARRGERRSLTLEDASRLEQLAVVGGLDREQEAERASEGRAELRDAEAAVGAARDHALRLEHPQRLAHRRAADPIQVDELSLRWERVAGAEAAGADQAQQTLCDELVRLLPCDWLEESLVRQADRLYGMVFRCQTGRLGDAASVEG